ncbi:MAG: hypothetical protein H6704_06080 [Myxococcales bacterium]|nr:hypothetical protein [Myxococcales bacterium]
MTLWTVLAATACSEAMLDAERMIETHQPAGVGFGASALVGAALWIAACRAAAGGWRAAVLTVAIFLSPGVLWRGLVPLYPALLQVRCALGSGNACGWLGHRAWAEGRLGEARQYLERACAGEPDGATVAYGPAPSCFAWVALDPTRTDDARRRMEMAVEADSDLWASDTVDAIDRCFARPSARCTPVCEKYAVPWAARITVPLWERCPTDG